MCDCALQFKLFLHAFRGESTDSCTRDDDPNSELWCSTRVDARGRHVTNSGNWGHCSDTCNNINRQGNLSLLRTVFPFLVRITYCYNTNISGLNL